MADIEVEAPDGAIITFPEGTDRDTMRAAMKKYIAKTAPTPEAAPAPEPENPHIKDLAERKKKFDAIAKGAMPFVPPPKATRLERIGGNLLSGLGDAGEKIVTGTKEAFGYGPEKRTQLAGYDMPNAVSGGANVIAGLGRAFGSVGGAAVDSVGTALAPFGDEPLVSEFVGENIAKPAMEGIKYISGSEKPGEDFAKLTGTDPRYYEALTNIVASPYAARAVGGVSKAIAALPTKMSRAEARSKHFYNQHDAVYDPSVVTDLGNKMDRIATENSYSPAADTGFKKMLKVFQDELQTGQPLDLATMKRFRENLKKELEGGTFVNPTLDKVQLESALQAIDDDILYNPNVAAVSGDPIKSSVVLKEADKLHAKVATMKTAIENKISDYVNKRAIFDGKEVKGDYKEQLTRQALNKQNLKSSDARVIVPRAQTKAAGRVVMGTRTGNTLQLVSRLGEAVPASMLSALATVAAISGRPELLLAAAGVFTGAKAAGGLSNLSKARSFKRFEKEVLRNKEAPLPPPPRTGVLTPRPNTPAPPRGGLPPPQQGPLPPSRQLPAPPRVTPSGPTATPPGPIPVSRQLPAPGDFTPPPSVIKLPNETPFSLPSFDEMAAIKKSMPEPDFKIFLQNLLKDGVPKDVGSGARSYRESAGFKRVVEEARALSPPKKRKKGK